MNRVDYDVIIAGAGMVGSCLALALARLPLRILVVDPAAGAAPGEAHFDARVTALANGSQRILGALDLWSSLAVEAQPIQTIHVSNRGSFGMARINARDEDVAALGYTVENQQLQRALVADRERWPNVEWRQSTRLVDAVCAAEQVTATLADGATKDSVTAKLVVAADGTRSQLRKVLGAQVKVHDYGQIAIVANCSTRIPHQGVAYERFTAQGPVAMLPLRRARSGFIWTLPKAAGEALASCPDDEFIAALQRAFGYRLGRFVRLGERQAYPLVSSSARPIAGQRMLLIGNAANTLHPVAGQGFNLALRDVSILAEIIDRQLAVDGDPGSVAVLDGYQQWREADQDKVAWFTHNLIGLFGMEQRAVNVGRNLGLVLFDLIPGAKAVLAKHTMGLAGRLPRLARGVPLANGRPKS